MSRLIIDLLARFWNELYCIHLYELVNWTPKLDTYSSSLNCEKVKMIRNRSKVLWRTILLMHTPHNVHTCTLYNYASFQNSTFLHYKWMRCLTALQARKIGSIKTLKKILIKTQVVIRTPVPTYGSDSAGRGKCLFYVLFSKKVEPPFDQTWLFRIDCSIDNDQIWVLHPGKIIGRPWNFFFGTLLWSSFYHTCQFLS